ncbi:nucleotide-diphosphate-sugar epimerase [Novosphingobium colocasiae]|uniref:Nucleotide-diphosphate-sugar epimerase n=2 Tax=Novosphingobium colocasiae TaxID=1256513 RepID=A0A918PIK5_9SPHN|nr:nucleotide-diphosphate-sugar epimerase [Novosphingobium colocasiae]
MELLDMDAKKILVTGATGAQGGAVVDAFLAAGWSVRALVRSPDSAASSALRERGVELAKGDLLDIASLETACRGCHAAFSVQMPVVNEVEGARNLAQAARAAGVKTMIHTSVSSTGWRVGLSPEKANFLKMYWDCKEGAEQVMRDAGFASCTILKPAFLMENFLLPKSPGMFPDLANRQIVMALATDKPFPSVATSDVGAAALAAATRPDDFNGVDVELAGDLSSVGDYAEVIGEVVGVPVSAQFLPADEVIARGQAAGWVESQRWSGEVGYIAKPEHQLAFGLHPTSFRTWAQAHAEGLRQATGSE